MFLLVGIAHAPSTFCRKLICTHDGEPKAGAADAERAIADRALISSRADIDVGEADRLVWHRGAGLADGLGRVHVKDNYGALGGADGGRAKAGLFIEWLAKRNSRYLLPPASAQPKHPGHGSKVEVAVKNVVPAGIEAETFPRGLKAGK